MREPAFDFAAVSLVLGFAVAGFAPQIFHDGDTWWHLAAGNWMLSHRAVPVRDVFTYTFAGAPWNAHEWLAEILMAAAFRVGSWSGLHVLFGLAFGIAAAIVGWGARKNMDALPALLVTVMGLASVGGSLLARPHILALPLLALWTWMLVLARQKNKAPPWWLALVMLLWANMHGSFAFGLALAAALGMEAVVESTDRIQAAKQWGLFLLAGILAALITPQGVAGLLFPIRLLAMPGLSTIGEWAPTDVGKMSPFVLALLTMIFVLAKGKVQLPSWRAILIVGLTWLALSHSRHVMLFGIAAPLLAAPAIGATWPARPAGVHPAVRIGAAAMMLALVLARLAFPAVRGEDRVSPMAALEAVPADLRGRPVLNAYDYGGYLIFQDVKVFIDGRTDMFSSDFLKNDDRLNAGDGAAMAATLSRYQVAWTILAASSPAAQTMDHLPGWHRLHIDTNAVVHVRDQPPPPG